MDIWGVVHTNSRLDTLDAKLQEAYPDGISSMMVELPENFDEISRTNLVPFFNELTRRWSERGCRIIYGDIPINIPDVVKKRIKSLIDYHDNGGPPSPFLEALYANIVWSLNAVFKILIPSSIDLFTTHIRDKHFQSVINDTNPEVVVVGRYHGTYLTRRYSDANYIRA